MAAGSLTEMHGRVPRCSWPTVGSSSTSTTVPRSSLTPTPRSTPGPQPNGTFAEVATQGALAN
jgi:hypothetical protein